MSESQWCYLDPRLHARIAERLDQLPIVADGLAYVLDVDCDYVTVAERAA